MIIKILWREQKNLETGRKEEAGSGRFLTPFTVSRRKMLLPESCHPDKIRSRASAFFSLRAGSEGSAPLPLRDLKYISMLA